MRRRIMDGDQEGLSRGIGEQAEGGERRADWAALEHGLAYGCPLRRPGTGPCGGGRAGRSGVGGPAQDPQT